MKEVKTLFNYLEKKKKQRKIRNNISPRILSNFSKISFGIINVRDGNISAAIMKCSCPSRRVLKSCNDKNKLINRKKNQDSNTKYHELINKKLLGNLTFDEEQEIYDYRENTSQEIGIENNKKILMEIKIYKSILKKLDRIQKELIRIK
jgi:hypothetical protein